VGVLRRAGTGRPSRRSTATGGDKSGQGGAIPSVGPAYREEGRKAVTRTPPPLITATMAAGGVTGPVPERLSNVTGQFADLEHVGGVRAVVPDLHGQHRVVEIQGLVSGRAKTVRRLGRTGATTEHEEGGGAQNRRQEAAVVVPGAYLQSVLWHRLSSAHL
jgi:hypothetical protein